MHFLLLFVAFRNFQVFVELQLIFNLYCSFSAIEFHLSFILFLTENNSNVIYACINLSIFFSY